MVDTTTLSTSYHLNSVADLEILRGGFSLRKKKVPAQHELKSKKKEKKVITNSLSHISHTETSLVTSTTPKTTPFEYLKVIFALHANSCP